MRKRASIEDFRFTRRKLPTKAFAVAPKRDPKPTDLIDQPTWSGITTLPDDVSLRTSEHHGTTLTRAYELWSHWPGLTIDLQGLIPEPNEDALCLASLTISDELQASLYAALTGFYRQAISGLRPALEATVAGVYFRASPNPQKFKQWADGLKQGRQLMQEMRRALGRIAPYLAFESGGGKDTLFGDLGWVNFLYGRTSAFSHGRPQYTDDQGNRIPTDNIGLWGGSNGPVYNWEGFRLWSAFYFDTALLCLLLVGLAEPGVLRVPKPYDLPYCAFLERVISWHFGLRPIAHRIIQHLAN